MTDQSHNPITFDRANTHIHDITDRAQMQIGEFTQAMNAISLIRAMQAGYAMACSDNGLPQPSFLDPAYMVSDNG